MQQFEVGLVTFTKIIKDHHQSTEDPVSYLQRVDGGLNIFSNYKDFLIRRKCRCINKDDP